jgi:hypothetical protein
VTSAILHRDATEIRRDIERNRRQTKAIVTTLQDRIQEATDWRVQVSRHPLLAAGLAAGAGAMVVGLLKPRGSATPAERLTDRIFDRVDDWLNRSDAREPRVRRDLASGIVRIAIALLSQQSLRGQVRGASSTTAANRRRMEKTR